MTSAMTIFFAGGGSGGHLYPGIAVAQALADVLPQARPVFLCTNREIDRTILSATPYEAAEQPILPPRRTLGGLLRFWRALRQTQDVVKDLLIDRRPAAVLGLGGYAAGVAVRAAAKSGIPTAILNPDVIPGKANTYLLRYVEKACCQFEATRDHVPPTLHGKLAFTGCPIRHDLTRPSDRQAAAFRLGLDGRLNTLVVTGASQGAQTVNDAVLEMLSLVRRDATRTQPLQGWQVLHLAGPNLADTVRAGYREAGLPAAVVDFTPRMDDVWAVADLAVSRSGASTCAELCALGVPSVLLPYPFHKDMHQRANARAVADAGGAIVVEDTKDRRRTAGPLREAVEPLLYDIGRRRAMASGARSLARPHAACEVARLLAGLVGDSRGGGGSLAGTRVAGDPPTSDGR